MPSISSDPSRPADSVSRVVHALATEIIDGTRRPGERLVAAEIAERLGVSRVPVREAFPSLAALGLADVMPNRGATVMRESSPADLLTVLHARARLEPWAMSIAATRRTDDDLVRIANHIRLGHTASRSGDVIGAIRAHAHLLDAFAEAVHDRAVEVALRPLYSLTGAIVTRTFRAVEVDGWKGHEGVLSALRAGEEERVAGLVSEHLEAMIEIVNLV